LFDAVFDFIVVETVTAIPITPDDLPEYAGKLFDSNEQHPDIARLVAWYRLERGGSSRPIPTIISASQHKIDAIRAAQVAGKLPSYFDAEQLLLLVQGLAMLWTSQPFEILDLVATESERARRRATVVEAVRKLLAEPDGSS
jgi:hypothetical protein